MRRAAILSMYVFLFLMVVTQPVAADAQLEIIISDTEVYENEEFGFDVKLTNPDALAYSGFHLYGRKGVEELEWGSHTFRGQDYTLYTYRYIISLRELGYYTLYVEAFSYFVEDIVLVESISIHVVERPPSAQPLLSVLFILAIVALLALCFYYVGRSIRKTKPTTTGQTAARARERPRIVERPRYTEPAPLILVVCPYCGAKNEQGMLKCRKCSAEI